MRSATLPFLLVIILSLALNGCGPGSSPSATPAMPPPTSVSPTLAPTRSTSVPVTPTLSTPPPTPVPPTPIARGKTLVVVSTADSGPGTLRQALEEAEPYDLITFDPAVFPPGAPQTIAVTRALPGISQGHLTIDASDVGVILDGSGLPRDTWIPGLDLVSDGNTIRGMRVINFTGTGIVVAFHGRNNTIGGDRSIGTGPTGQGNLCSGNDFGIGLWDSAANNVVTGNLVGTDASGTGDDGNRSAGVWITEGGYDNVIGPDNIIAHNHGAGILVEGSDCSGNTITRNRIYGNGGVGIHLASGGNGMVGAPYTCDFDLVAGSATGITCANCTVEIFSDGSDEAAVYEGQAVADSSGAFSFDKGVAFVNTNVTATATDADGNTSEFSMATKGTCAALSLQQGNDLPQTPLEPKPSQELEDNHIGVHAEDFVRYSNPALVYPNGFKWIRIQSLTDFWDPEGGDEYGHKIFTLESIPPSVDKVISDYATNGVCVVLGLWMGAGLRPYGTLFQSEEEVEQFIEYVGFVVSHFKGRIPYYEIWNEPGQIAVGDYANLVGRVVPVIRQEDPGARIIIGAVAGPWDNGYPGYGRYQRYSLNVDYLNELLRSGVAPLVDGISWHPLYSNIPSDPYYQDIPQMVKGIKELATAQGFTGEYFADELLWSPVAEEVEGWAGGPPVSQLTAAKYYARAITEHRGLGVNVTINTFFVEGGLSPIHNLCDTLAGAEPVDLALSVASEATNIRHYAFSLPDGGRLVALWTNGEAVDHDRGVITNLTFPDLHAKQVEGIDVLHGLQQELVTETENGNMAIRGLLVKDYPIIIRFTNTKSS